MAEKGVGTKRINRAIINTKNIGGTRARKAEKTRCIDFFMGMKLLKVRQMKVIKDGAVITFYQNRSSATHPYDEKIDTSSFLSLSGLESRRYF